MLRLVENKIAVTPIPDPDYTDAQHVNISEEELRYMGVDPSSVNSTISIVKPDVAKERTDQGIVKYVGPKVKDIAIGDYVLFGGYTGTTIHLEGEGSLIIFREDFVVCRIDAPDTDINGLYFRGQGNPELLNTLLYDLLYKAEANGVEWTHQEIMKLFAIHGDPYFPATYEMAVNIMADSFKNHPFRKNLKILNKEDSRERLSD